MVNKNLVFGANLRRRQVEFCTSVKLGFVAAAGILFTYQLNYT